MNSIVTDLSTLLPELIVACSALLLLLVGALTSERTAEVISWAGVVALAASAYFVATTSGPAMAFHGAFVVDGFSQFAKELILLGSALTLLMSRGYMSDAKLMRFEFPVLVLLSTCGMMLMVSSASFISLYMGLELQSLCLYVLASFNRDNVRSSEAGMKYFVLGALSSGMMLYGITWIYGFTGSTEFSTVAHVVQVSTVSVGLIVGIVFLIAGLAFKVSAVPFHMWTPDVYEGAPTPITGFLAMAPKVAAMALFLRAMVMPFPHVEAQWQQIIIFISAASMILGSFAAIGQSNIKRLMAYSSIGHMGYALLGLVADSVAGIKGVLIYLMIYVISNAGVFIVIMAMKRDGKQLETISDLAGLSRTQPRLAFAFAALMISLAGIPPLAGFWAKFYVFLAVMEAGQYWLAVLGVLTSVVGAYYYWRIVKVMYFDEPAQPFTGKLGLVNGLILTGVAAFTLFFVVFGGPLIASAGTAAATLIP